MIALPTDPLSTSGLCLPTIPCPSQIIDAGNSVGGALAAQAATSVFQSVADGLNQATDWLFGTIVQLVTDSASPQMGASWFIKEMGLMEQVALAVVLPVLLAATIGPLLRQDGRRLLRVWGVGLPLALFSGLAASQAAGLLLSATDAMCALVLGSDMQRLGQQFSNAMAAAALSPAPLFVQIALALIAVLGAVLVWLELMVRSAGVYVATFFMPLTLIGYIWPATAGMARRGIEILVTLILSKFVILASIGLGLAAWAGGGVDASLSGAAVLLIAAFAPFALLRLAPVVEASAIAHLEGMARRPVRAATRAMATPLHPAAQAGMAAASARRSGAAEEGGGLGTRPVTSQSLPWRRADFPLGDRPGGGAGAQDG